MRELNHIVPSFDFNHCVHRDGFVFTSIGEPANVLNAIVIRNPENCDCWSPKKSYSQYSLEEHISFINKYNIEKAFIIAEDIKFITRCPTLKYIEIVPADSAQENFDYSSIYKMPKLRYVSCRTQYGKCEEKSTVLDYSYIQGVTELWVRGTGHLNYDKIKRLESLYISEDKCRKNLQNFANCKSIKKLDLCQTKLTSLEGIKSFKNLESISLAYCRCLKDISELSSLFETLRTLSINSCSKITDFSCLEKLTNLVHLELFGNNELPDLYFINELKRLKTFTFSMHIADYDLTPCLNIPYVYSARNKKQYNLKDKDLPKTDNVNQGSIRGRFYD